MLVLSIVCGAFTALILYEFVLAYPPKVLEDTPLSRKQQAFLAAASEVFFPENGPLPSYRDANVLRFLDQTFQRAPKRQQLLLQLLFFAIEHGPLVFGPLQARFTRLTLEQRIAHLTSWEQSALYFRRTAFLSLRTVMTLAYFDDPVVSTTLMPEDAR